MKMSKKLILGTTIESNHIPPEISPFAPTVNQRITDMNNLPPEIRKMVSIEPIMDFDEVNFLAWIRIINPEFVSIGADSQRHGLPEPSSRKIRNLILGLKKFTKVEEKDNLKRLLTA